MNTNITKNGRLKNSQTFTEKSAHPFITQLRLLGYQDGDRVTGRCFGGQYPLMWEATLQGNELDLWTQKKDYPDGLSHIWVKKQHHPEGLRFLHERNEEARPVQFNVNGGVTKKEVTHPVAFFFENDYFTKEKQWEVINSFPIKPTLVVDSGNKSLQVYYRWEDTVCPPEDWEAIQKYLTLVTNSDPAIKDLPRTMKAAGFKHPKTGRVATIMAANDIGYSKAQVEEAIHQHYPHCSPARYKVYQLVSNQNTSKEYQFNLPPEYAYSLQEKECEAGEKKVRLYCEAFREEDYEKAQSIWETPLGDIQVQAKKKAKAREKRKNKYQIVSPSGQDSLSTVTGELASYYCDGFEEDGRSEWHTCRCPVHAGHSPDSLHINKETGVLKCQSGCDPEEVEEELRRLGRKNNHPLADKRFAKPSTGDSQITKEIGKVRGNTKETPDLSYEAPDQRSLVDDERFQASKFNLVKGGMGTGKTASLEEVVTQAVREGAQVILVAHRISLVKQMCDRLGVPYTDETSLDYKGKRGLCINSFHNNGKGRFTPEDAAGAYIIIDEFDQTMKALVEGNTMKEKRYSICSTLLESLKVIKEQGGKFIGLSAHISQAEVKLLEFLTGEKPYLIENTHSPLSVAETKAHIMPSENTHYALIEEEIKKGGKLFIGVPGQKEESVNGTKSWESYLEDKYPHLTILRADSETLQQEGHPAYNLSQKLNDNPEYLMEVDILLCTTSLETGFSFDKTPFTSVHIHAGDWQDSKDICQWSLRVRNLNIPRYIFRSNRAKTHTRAGGTMSRKVLRNRLLKEGNETLSILSSVVDYPEDDEENPLAFTISGIKAFEEYYLSKSIEANADHLDPTYTLELQLIEEGYTLVKYTPDDDTDEDTEDVTEDDTLEKLESQGKVVKRELKVIREEKTEKKVTAIANTPAPDSNEYERLKAKKEKGMEGLTPEEQNTFNKGAMNRRYAQEVDQEVVKADLERKYKPLREYYDLTCGNEEYKRRELRQIERFTNDKKQIFISDLRESHSRRIELLKYLDVDQRLQENGFTRQGLNSWFKLIEASESCQKALKELGASHRPKNKNTPDDPIKLLRRLLKLLDLKLDRKRERKEDGNREYVYYIKDPLASVRDKACTAWAKQDERSILRREIHATLEGKALVSELPNTFTYHAFYPEVIEGGDTIACTCTGDDRWVFYRYIQDEDGYATFNDGDHISSSGMIHRLIAEGVMVAYKVHRNLSPLP